MTHQKLKPKRRKVHEVQQEVEAVAVEEEDLEAVAEEEADDKFQREFSRSNLFFKLLL